MATFAPRAGDSRYCSGCGAMRSLHLAPAMACPQPYRPDTLAAAQLQLRSALARGDQAAMFVARGDVQRLGGDPDEEAP